jgi:hypothetical protein
MSAALDLFVEVGLGVLGKPDAYDKLCVAAELWRGDGQFFSAGMAMARAVDAAWGEPKRMLEAHRLALRDFEQVIAEEPAFSPAGITSCGKP